MTRHRREVAGEREARVDAFPLLPADHCLHVAAWHLAIAAELDQAADERRAMALFAEADAQQPPKRTERGSACTDNKHNGARA
jgi:hypothetical protein